MPSSQPLMAESPRVAPVVDLPHPDVIARVRQDRSLTPKGSVVTGPYRFVERQRASHGITRRLSPRPWSRQAVGASPL
jgi:hypothetical protein